MKSNTLLPVLFPELVADTTKLKLIVSGHPALPSDEVQRHLVGRTWTLRSSPSHSGIPSFNQVHLRSKAYTERRWTNWVAIQGVHPLWRYPRSSWPGVRKEKYTAIIDTYVKRTSDLAESETRQFNKLLEVLAGQSGQLVNMTSYPIHRIAFRHREISLHLEKHTSWSG